MDRPKVTLGQLMKQNPGLPGPGKTDWHPPSLTFDTIFDNDQFFDESQKTCPPEMRGEEPYYPPCGWKQRGIKIEGTHFLLGPPLSNRFCR
jgi:hypothetical protein